MCASAYASLSSPVVSVTPTRVSWCSDIVYLAHPRTIFRLPWLLGFSLRISSKPAPPLHPSEFLVSCPGDVEHCGAWSNKPPSFWLQAITSSIWIAPENLYIYIQASEISWKQPPLQCCCQFAVGFWVAWCSNSSKVFLTGTASLALNYNPHSLASAVEDMMASIISATVCTARWYPWIFWYKVMFSHSTPCICFT